MPNINQVRESRTLSNLSSKYRSEGHIHMDLFPMVPVAMKEGKYRIYDRNFRLAETSRADGGMANVHSFDVSNASYALERHALKDYLTQDVRDNYIVGDPRADIVEELTDQINRRKEKKCADLFTSTNWAQGVSLASAGKWSLDTVTSSPILAVDSGTSQILLNAGVKANILAFREDVRKAAKNHQSVLDRVKYTQRDVDNGTLSALFGVENILVASSAIDSSAEGVASSIDYIWGDNVFIGYNPQRPGLKVVSSGYMFAKNGANRVKSWIDSERDDAEALEVQSEFQFKIVASLSGYLIKDAL